jgi:hypothetical protein
MDNEASTRASRSQNVTGTAFIEATLQKKEARDLEEVRLEHARAAHAAKKASKAAGAAAGAAAEAAPVSAAGTKRKQNPPAGGPKPHPPLAEVLGFRRLDFRLVMDDAVTRTLLHDVPEYEVALTLQHAAQVAEAAGKAFYVDADSARAQITPEFEVHECGRVRMCNAGPPVGAIVCAWQSFPN